MSKKCLSCSNESDDRKFCSYQCYFYHYSDRSSNCWIWNGSRSKNGYGRIASREKRSAWVSAHRKAYEMFKGIIPKGIYVCHKCDTPECVNPDHLFLGTARDNFHDAMNKGRTVYGMARGDNHGHAKLNSAQVLEIREKVKQKKSARMLSEKYQVSLSTIYSIKYRKWWKHIGG